MRELQARTNARLGVFSMAKRSLIVEGANTSIVRPSGDVEDTTLRTASAEFAVRFDEVPHLNHQKVVDILENIAADMASQMSAGLAEEVSDAAEKVGNVVSGEGKPFGVEKLFEVWDKIQIDFDAAGNPKWPSVSAAPEMLESFVNALRTLESHPVWRSRMEQLIVKKREEWRAREANRELAG